MPRAHYTHTHARTHTHTHAHTRIQMCVWECACWVCGGACVALCCVCVQLLLAGAGPACPSSGVSSARPSARRRTDRGRGGCARRRRAQGAPGVDALQHGVAHVLGHPRLLQLLRRDQHRRCSPPPPPPPPTMRLRVRQCRRFARPGLPWALLGCIGRIARCDDCLIRGDGRGGITGRFQVGKSRFFVFFQFQVFVFARGEGNKEGFGDRVCVRID